VANLTLVVDDDVLKRSRIRALNDGTSVNAVVRAYLALYAADDATIAGARFVELARETQAGSGAAGRQWRREDVYVDATSSPR
jgi:plasmid stability protein